MKNYRAANPTNWQGRISKTQAYWYQHIQLIDLLHDALAPPGTALLGYRCDEGVRRNQGRVGAAEGPTKIRNMIGNMAWHLARTVYDVGDIYCENGELEDAQNDLANAVTLLLKKNMTPIVIGGGHDIAFGHFCGISTFLDQHDTNSKIGIINFDAHFDLRTVETSGNSGTPFYQIAQNCKIANKPFNYLCLGIQRAANTKELFDRAAELNVDYCLNEELTHFNFHHQEARITTFIEKVDHIYLTIDMDVFSSAYAPGVSAASPVGISPEVFFTLLASIIASDKTISIDIAEFNPIYDIDHHTAKLAARIVEHIYYLQ